MKPLIPAASNMVSMTNNTPKFEICPVKQSSTGPADLET